MSKLISIIKTQLFGHDRDVVQGRAAYCPTCNDTIGLSSKEYTSYDPHCPTCGNKVIIGGNKS